MGREKTQSWEESELREVKRGLIFHILRDERDSLFVWVENFMRVLERNDLLSWTKVSARNAVWQPGLHPVHMTFTPLAGGLDALAPLGVAGTI